ncbi:hypothetical protein [Gordonia sp. p3-SID1431]|uniref:hypothetical protein n=1 Tax=Gordonia sp. p3-SID1431 TaxID=2916159 RepID=UPI0021A36705|nr:hypothetical protein [Gordonia sp. p3-SID1431]MCT1352237.1 hypothetical protein [Gordonia sp. p3-SID1431]
MTQPNPLYTLTTLLAPALGRVAARATAGRTLEEWGLNPHRADPGTSMAIDDEDGYEEKIPEGLTGTVMYPIMNAVDALVAIDILISTAASEAPFNHHTPTFLSLCRTVIECSAQAIWVLGPPERETRRARAAGLAKIGIEHAIEYHKDVIEAHEKKLHVVPDIILEQSKHRLKFHTEELHALNSIPQQNGRKYSELVRKAANWISNNPPEHSEEFAAIPHFPTMAKQEYRECSAFTHGHSWAIDLISQPTHMFAMMADAIATALVFAECAVCLYEAQSTDPDSTRKNHYAERLQTPLINGEQSTPHEGNLHFPHDQTRKPEPAPRAVSRGITPHNIECGVA